MSNQPIGIHGLGIFSLNLFYFSFYRFAMFRDTLPARNKVSGIILVKTIFNMGTEALTFLIG